MTRLLLLLGISVALHGQAPTALGQHFQGREVMVLLDMPGDESGVDVYAREAAAVPADLIRSSLSTELGCGGARSHP